MMPDAVPASQDRVDLPLLVGRERERQRLRGHLAAAAGGQGCLVLVAGEAGIGKSSLTEVTAREAVASGALVLTGACYDLIATPPYGPWLEAATRYRPTNDLPPPRALTDGDGVAAAGGQGALYAQVGEFFAAVAAVRPVVLVLEDLHWADPPSLELLRFVARQAATLRLVVVVTYRSDELTRRHPLYQLIPTLVREAKADRIDLRRLDETGVRALVAGRYRLAAADEDRLVDYLQRHAEGNPLYAYELLRSLDEEGLLRSTDGRSWILDDVARQHVPPLLVQVIEGRLARLGEELREPLAVAAVIGQEVPLDLWATVSGRTEEELLPVVERATEAHLLAATSGGAAVRFTHALIREALYEGVLPLRRRSWHRGVGATLAAAAGSDPDAVAYHFQQAGDAQAGEWLVRAGERAQRAYAWRTAADRFEAAAALLAGDEPRARDRGWLLYRIGRLLRFADPVRGIPYLQEAERVATGVADPVLAAFALFDRGTIRCIAGDMGPGLAETEAGNAALHGLAPEQKRLDEILTVWVADALPASTRPRTDLSEAVDWPVDVHPRQGTLAIQLAIAGRIADAAAIGESYVTRVARLPRPGLLLLSSLGDAFSALGIVYAALGRPDEASRAFAQARDALTATDHDAQIDYVRQTELLHVVLPYHAADVGQRQFRAAEASELSTRFSGAAHVGWSPRITLLGLLLVDGSWVEARRVALDDIAQRYGHGAERTDVRWTLGVLAHAQGDVALAWTQVRAVLPGGPATAPGEGEFFTPFKLQRVAAALALDAGDTATALAWLEAHDRWFAWSGYVLGQAEARLTWARYLRATGDPVTARHQASEAVAHAAAPRQPLALLAAHRLLGELEADAGDVAAAERHLSEALMLADACAAPFERALTLLAQAESRAASGQGTEALPLLDEVRAICVPLGAAPTLARVDALETRLATTPPVAAYPAGLSGREVEVLRLVAEGLTDAEAADRLSISPRTVGQHLRSVYNKLGVSSRAAATRLAVEHDLL